MAVLWHALRKVCACLRAVSADSGHTCLRCGVCHRVRGLLERQKSRNDAKALEE
ncbi:hypothetical protein [uncultured Desulfovibrio sp.]|uniref:hypothetical protein n=1 Tax=uncultured Desulfovibrio sp. TaxID=167968 RepID=UPI0026077BCC|nr:hypothetical protein [uncultured Desulfovibrio sp.]